MFLLSILKTYSKHKLAFKTSKCVFLGYSSFHKGYKCLHPSGRIYIARSVTFDEPSFPYQLLFVSQSPTAPSQNIRSYGAPSFVIPSAPVCSPSKSVPASDFTPVQHYNCSRQSDSCSEQSSYVPLIQVPFLAPSSKGITFTDSKNATTSFENVIAAPITKSISDKATSIPLATLPSTSVHPMQTRSKSGIFKPKVLTAMLHCEPSTVPLALADPRWKEAMETEYQALPKNNTWELVLSKMEAPIVKDEGSNYQRWRLQIWRLQIVNNLATNPPFFLPC